MKITIPKNSLSENPESWLRHAGYGLIFDRQRGVQSFVRRLGNNFYPRIHLYVEEQGENWIFNLHLDQKQASYAGAHIHNAEYDGEVVGAEVERLKSLLLFSL